MKRLLFIPVLFLSMAIFAATPARLKDGKIDFAVSTTDDKPAFTIEEENAMLNADFVTKSVEPTINEVNIASCSLKFSNYSEYINCLTNKDSLKVKIVELRQRLNNSSDFNDAETADLQQRINWLKSYYQTLP